MSTAHYDRRDFGVLHLLQESLCSFSDFIVVVFLKLILMQTMLHCTYANNPFLQSAAFCECIQTIQAEVGGLSLVSSNKKSHNNLSVNCNSGSLI